MKVQCHFWIPWKDMEVFVNWLDEYSPTWQVRGTQWTQANFRINLLDIYRWDRADDRRANINLVLENESQAMLARLSWDVLHTGACKYGSCSGPER